jgi:hypothetical protein
MSAEEIARVVDTHTPRGGNEVDLPCASEVVVKGDDDDWYPALVLQVRDGQYLIHYVGHEMEENEWVGEDRVRFPAGSHVPALIAPLGANGIPRKAPMEAEV